MIGRCASHAPEKSTQHDKEGFYQYQLNFKIHNQDLGRKLWAKQPRAPSPDLTLLGNQQSSADSVAYTLDRFVRSHQRHGKQPLAQTFDQYREAKPSSLAERWLLRSGENV